MEKFRWGVVGTGKIAGTVCAQLKASGRHEIVAVYSRTRSRAEAFAQGYGAVCHDTMSAFCADPRIQGVYIATPHSAHYGNMLACIGAGMSVLCEKSFTVNAAQAERVFAFAEEKGVFVAEAMWTRFHPLVRGIKARADAGEFGAVRRVTGKFCTLAGLFRRFFPERVTSPRYAGGALLDLGVYPISMCEYFLGEPDEVQAKAKCRGGIDLYDEVSLRYANGAEGLASCSFLCRSRDDAVIECEKGKIVLSRFPGMDKAVIYGADGKKVQMVADPSTYVHEFDEAARAIRAGETQTPMMTKAHTLAVMRVMDACRAQAGLRYPEEIERL